MLDFVRQLANKSIVDLCKLAFAATMVEYSNYSYEPSLGRRAAAGRADVEDYPVAATVAEKLDQMADDADWYRRVRVRPRRRSGRVFVESFFEGYSRLQRGSVDLLVTSPPYANNYHYNRNTRPHLYWLGYCTSPDDLRRLEPLNFGTYWQHVREREHVKLDETAADTEIQHTLAQIRKRNPD